MVIRGETESDGPGDGWWKEGSSRAAVKVEA